jgi:hypothetical protein
MELDKQVAKIVLHQCRGDSIEGELDKDWINNC